MRLALQEMWHCPSWRPHCLAPLHTNTYTQMQPTVPREKDTSISDHITPMCDKCVPFFFLLFCLPLPISLFRFQIICFQRHREASVSAVSVGNWVQKWHLAFRSDRLRAICSVFADSGTVDVLRTHEETGNGAWNTADSGAPSPHMN